MMRTIITFLVFLLPSIVDAQETPIPRDTSFTVNGSFVKEQKKFPFIRIANPPLSNKVAVAGNILYKTIGNRQLHVDVFYPKTKNNKGYPGVLLIHGGGWRSGDRSQAIPIAQQLAAKGYVAVAVEYRLTPEAAYPASIYDLKAAIRWLRSQAGTYNLDITKIAVMGFSSGGQLAALIGTTNGDPHFDDPGDAEKFSGNVQAIIDVDGILAFKHPESEEGAVAASWLGGTFEEKPMIWNEASPLSHVNKDTPPTLFINSALPRFHAGRDDMIRKLELFKTYTEVHTIPDTPHPFWFFEPWFEKVVAFTVEFLDKVFKE